MEEYWNEIGNTENSLWRWQAECVYITKRDEEKKYETKYTQPSQWKVNIIKKRVLIQSVPCGEKELRDNLVLVIWDQDVIFF